MWSLAEIQLRPSAALTWTVTLSWGAAAMALSEGSGLGSVGLAALGRGRGGLAGRGRGSLGDLRLRSAVVAALERGEPDEADHGDDRGDHGRGPVGSAPLGTDAFRLEEGGRRGRGRAAAVIVVVLREQRGRIEVDGLGQGPDVAAGVDVAAAGGEVVRLDGVHDGDADPGGVADVVDGQPGRDPRLLQGMADGEAGFLVGSSSNGRSSSGELPMDTGAPFERVSHLCWRFSLGGVRKGGATGRWDFVRHRYGRTRRWWGMQPCRFPQLDVRRRETVAQ